MVWWMVFQKRLRNEVFLWLVVWSMNFIVPYIGNNIHPNDFHILQRGRYNQPDEVFHVSDWGFSLLGRILRHIFGHREAHGQSTA